MKNQTCSTSAKITSVEMCEFLHRVSLVPRLPNDSYVVLIDMIDKLNFDEFVHYDRAEAISMFMVGQYKNSPAQAAVKVSKAIKALVKAGIISVNLTKDTNKYNQNLRLNRYFDTLAGPADEYEKVYYRSADYLKRFMYHIVDIKNLTQAAYQLLMTMVGDLDFIDYRVFNLEKAGTATGLGAEELHEAIERLVKYGVVSINDGESNDNALTMKLNPDFWEIQK